MKKAKKQLTLGRKILYAVLAVALLVALIYLSYYLIRFTFFDKYKQYVGSYEYEQGMELQLHSTSLADYPDYKLVCETGTLEMYLNEADSNVAIRDKRTGKVTFSAPVAADEDALANETNKKLMKAHLLVNYYPPNRGGEGSFDSYTMAVERDQVTYESIEGGVRVIYNMGDFSDSIGVVAWYLTPEKYDEIVSQLTEKEAKDMNNYYAADEKTAGFVPGFKMLIPTARTNRFAREKIQAIMEKVGFTVEDCAEQMELAGAEVVVPISFKIPLEYRLKDDYVEISVPTCAIEEGGGASLFRIQMVRFFDAASTEEEGYMVVPNGDGSLINFNNGKTNVNAYSQYIYGIDPLAADYTILESSNPATMALYGICKEDSTILATIEDGASFASVTASISGSVNSYNNVYTSFVVRGSEKLEMFGTTGNEASLPVVEGKLHDSMLTVRYTFMDENHQGYTGMANYYRERLIEEGVLTAQTSDESTKFYYDVISGVEMTKFFLGKQYMSMYPMTTFEEAGQISDQLAAAGITNQVMNLQGWFNNGYYHDATETIRVPWKLGGKGGLEKLNQTVAENGGSMYADVAFQKVANGSRYYNYNAESSKYYGSGYIAYFGQVNPATLRQTSSLGYSETMYDLISPKFLVRYTGNFADKIQGYDVSGISLRDLGSELHSDKKRTEIIDREAALDVVRSQLALLKDTQKNILVNSSNDYAWSYADDIINLPLTDNRYSIVDQNIPLYEMIVHGYIDYCGETYNLSSVENNQRQILNMIEYGAAPHFVFTWAETSDMKYSGVNSKYSTTFSVWADEAVCVYEEVSSVLNRVDGAAMVSHEILDSGVRKVQYSNDVTIYVNYSNEAAAADGLQVPAMGYVVK